jgi:hypothetical protein
MFIWNYTQYSPFRVDNVMKNRLITEYRVTVISFLNVITNSFPIPEWYHISILSLWPNSDTLAKGEFYLNSLPRKVSLLRKGITKVSNRLHDMVV